MAQSCSNWVVATKNNTEIMSSVIFLRIWRVTDMKKGLLRVITRLRIEKIYLNVKICYINAYNIKLYKSMHNNIDLKQEKRRDTHITITFKLQSLKPCDLSISKTVAMALLTASKTLLWILSF